ncbi:hypothetical protein ACMFMQ_23540 [Pseudomonas aeruginosa]|uniref:hypothetical protein n=1 Tax=Pseudomonas aeruginosa TaxID=287 RepID=UPI0039BC44B0
MNKANECTCPSGDGSLRHPCPAHPASVELAGVAANLTFINGRPAMCGCQVEYSSGGGEYSDVIYVTLCAKHSGSAILDLVATNRIALTPEYEGQWHADLYLDREIPLAKAEGATPAEAVLALMSAERIDPEQESVEQAGGDERDFQAKGAQEVPSPVSKEYDRHLIGLLRKGEALPGHQEEAADEIERLRDWNDHLNNTVLPNILNPNFLMLMKGGERLLDLCTKDGEFIGVSLNDMKDVFDWMVTHARIAPDQAALAQPSPAQAEKAEAERPEVVAWQYRVTAGPQTGWSLWHPGKGEEFERSYTVERRPLMTVAQHERIVGELRSDRDSWAEQAEQRLADWDEMRKERDAALARVAELERQEPVALANRGLHAFWVKWTEAAAGLYGPGIKLYAAPVVQAQQLHDLDKQCRDDVARALGLRPNQERGFAWSYLLASIKSCVKASEDSAQAQHSVPEGWVQSLPLKDHQPCKPNEDRANGYTIPIYSRPVLVEEALRKLRAVLCDPIGNVVIDGSDGDREEVQRALGMLAAAPGKEGV